MNTLSAPAPQAVMPDGAHVAAPPVTLLVVDDHTLFRRGLIALLGQDDGLVVVGEAGDAAEALRLAPRLAPQVILLDNHLPGVKGVVICSKPSTATCWRRPFAAPRGASRWSAPS